MAQPQIPHDVDPFKVTAALDEAQQAQNQPVNDVAAAQAGQAPNPDNKVSISSLSFSLLVLSYFLYIHIHFVLYANTGITGDMGFVVFTALLF